MPQNKQGGKMKVGVRDAAGRYIDTFDIMVQLPWAALTSVVVHHDMTVNQLKTVVEFAVGLPSDVMTIGYKRHAALANNHTLRELKMIPGDRITVVVENGLEDLVAGAVSGNTQRVINDINKKWDEGNVARRRLVVMFISAHRGYHYLVERMLTDGCQPDAATPSGRTALHIACAMGNGGCIDALLQRGANTMIKDANNKTPAQLAFSCGQQESERRLVLYERARSRQTRRTGGQQDWLQTLPTSSASSSNWSRSPRFPVSRLARSVTPTLQLQELSLGPAPGPELHVKSLSSAVKTKTASKRWLVRRLTQADLDQFSGSDSEDSDPADVETDLPQMDETVFDDDNGGDIEQNTIPMTPDSSRSTSGATEDTMSIVNTQSTSSTTMAPSSPAIRPPHLLPTRTTAWQQDTRKVRFNESPRSRGPTMPKATSTPLPKSFGPGLATFSPESPTTNGSNHSSISDVRHGSSPGHFLNIVMANDDQEALTNGGSRHTSQRGRVPSPRGISPTPRSTSSTPRVGSARTRSPRFHPRYPDDRYGRDEILDIRRVKDVQAAMEVSVGLRETTEQPFLSNGRKKATPEENCEAFNDWLDSKVQGAKDKSILNNVQKMLDEAFGRADEEIKRQEENRPKRSGQSYETWMKQKAEDKKKMRVQQQEKQTQEDVARKNKASEEAENELLIKAWILRKNEMERQQRTEQQRNKRDKRRRLSVQQQAAQQAFSKWRMTKEWEELERLKEGQEFLESSLKIGKLDVKRPTAKKRAKSASSISSRTRHSNKTAS